MNLSRYNISLKYLGTLILTLLSFVTLGLKAVNAQERIESSNYRIQFPNLNSGAGIPTSSSYRLDTTLGQTAAGQFSSTGYKVKAGFQYIHSIIPFSFSISDIQKDFGAVLPTNPVTVTSTITVSSGGASGYQVKAAETYPLKTSDGLSTVVDTLCDTTCSESSAASWTSSTKYGFGFNMSGNDIPGDFVNSNYFRQFADLSNSETPQVIMSSSNVGSGRTSTISYKINISSTQPSGTYTNIIKFSAIPTY